MFIFHGIAGSIITIGFITKRMLALERVDAVQTEPPFLLLSKEKDKRRLCSQGVCVIDVYINATVNCIYQFYFKSCNLIFSAVVRPAKLKIGL